MTGRAKWDAWTAAGNTCTTKTDAENRYLEIARSLGWTQGVTQELEGATGSSGESGGFGTSVSAMARPEDDNDTSLHGLAVSNDLQGLKELLEREPNVDVRDESSGCTPLHLAADRGHKAIVEFLLAKGADRTLKDEDSDDGLTAVQLAQTRLELARDARHKEDEERYESIVKLLD